MVLRSASRTASVHTQKSASGIFLERDGKKLAARLGIGGLDRVFLTPGRLLVDTPGLEAGSPSVRLMDVRVTIINVLLATGRRLNNFFCNQEPE